MQETLADKLKKIRGNESRKSFSLKYGIHEQSLIRYEKGTRIPDNDLILRIANGEVYLLIGSLRMRGRCTKLIPLRTLIVIKVLYPLKKRKILILLKAPTKRTLITIKVLSMWIFLLGI